MLLSFSVGVFAETNSKMSIVQGSGGHKYLTDSTNAEKVYVPERLQQIGIASRTFASKSVVEPVCYVKATALKTGIWSDYYGAKAVVKSYFDEDMNIELSIKSISAKAVAYNAKGKAIDSKKTTKSNTYSVTASAGSKSNKIYTGTAKAIGTFDYGGESVIIATATEKVTVVN